VEQLGISLALTCEAVDWGEILSLRIASRILVPRAQSARWFWHNPIETT